MNELLLKRITRALENLGDEQGYRVLDYVEFLESKYSTGTRPPSLLERVAAGVEDTLRASRIPVAAIRGTMGAVDSASRMMERLAQAGRAAADELGKSVAELSAAQAPRPDEPSRDSVTDGEPKEQPPASA
ncbi:MAG TPA: hypothetical protein VJ992_08945 [Gemmatimonadales bacterium]|nr:hypothetical protein [Gemmatimonadales bacterium]